MALAYRQTTSKRFKWFSVRLEAGVGSVVRVQGSEKGCRVWGAGLMDEGAGSMVSGSGSRL